MSLSAKGERRRKLVHDIYYKRGIHGPTEILHILKDEFGVECTRASIYEDLEQLQSGFFDEIGKFSIGILEDMHQSLIMQKQIIKQALESGDVKSASDANFKLISMEDKFYRVSRDMHTASKDLGGVVGKTDAPKSFSFGRVEVVDKKPLEKRSRKDEVDVDE